MQRYVTMFDKCGRIDNDVTMCYNNRTTLCNSLHLCEIMLEQNVEMCNEIQQCLMFVQCQTDVTKLLYHYNEV